MNTPSSSSSSGAPAKKCDILVIGAGPSSLAFVHAVLGLNTLLKIVVVDAGKNGDARDHSLPTDIGEGAGGAGLFSDGKFSFFPAGTAVWKTPHWILGPAYSTMINVMKLSGAQSVAAIPPLPSPNEIKDYYFDLGTNRWALKKYPTIILELDERRRMIAQGVDTASAAGVTFFFQSRVKYISHNPTSSSRYDIFISGDESFTLQTEWVVCAGGRFFPFHMPVIAPFLRYTFKRYEFGIRIENKSDNASMAGLHEWKDVPDPKYVYNYQPGIEFRTFCWCREGEVASSVCGGLTTFSGRSDVGITHRSNFGLMIRVTDPSLLSASEFRTYCQFPTFKTELMTEWGTGFSHLGATMPSIAKLLTSAVGNLFKQFPHLQDVNSVIYGPCIEGTGDYPAIDENMMAIPSTGKEMHNSTNILCIGDTSGIYRGIIPSMLGGAIAAHSVFGPRFFGHKMALVTSSMHKAIEIRTVTGFGVKIIDGLLFAPCSESWSIQQTCTVYSDMFRDSGHGMIVEKTKLFVRPSPDSGWIEFDALPEGWKNAQTKREMAARVVCWMCALPPQAPLSHTPITIRAEVHGSVIDACESVVVSKKNTPPTYGWDDRFVPHGHKTTYGQMGVTNKHFISARTLALNGLRKRMIADSQNTAWARGALIIGVSGKIGSGKNFVAEKILAPLFIAGSVGIVASADFFKMECLKDNDSLQFDEVFGEKTPRARLMLQATSVKYMTTPEGVAKSRKVWESAIRLSVMNGNTFVIMPDVRYKRQLDMLRELGGKIIRVVAPDRTRERIVFEAHGDANMIEKITTHPSETELDECVHDGSFDLVVNNDKKQQLNCIREQVEKFVRESCNVF